MIQNIDIFFTETLDINWEYVNTIPEFNFLNITPQSTLWHSEGNVMIHTKNVCGQMYKLIRENERYINDLSLSKVMMTAALFHDIGKGITTKVDEENEISSKYHAVEGARITRKLLWDINFETRELICNLVLLHMKPLYFKEKRNPLYNLIEMSIDLIISPNYPYLTLEDLYNLKMCDCMGSFPSFDNDEAFDYVTILNDFKNISIEHNMFNKPYSFLNNHSMLKYFNGDDELPPFITYDKKDFEVIIMIGLPGAGKDTYIKDKYSYLPSVCRDDIRTEIGLKGEKPYGNKKQEDLVTNIVNERIKNYCSKKQSFVINATSLKKIYRNKFTQMVGVYNPKITMVYIEAPNFKDNLNRRKGQISPSIIEGMLNGFDFPKQKECEELIIFKQ